MFVVSNIISTERRFGIKSAPNLHSKLGHCIEFKLAVQPYKHSNGQTWCFHTWTVSLCSQAENVFVSEKKKVTGYEKVKRLISVYADDIPQMLDGATHCKNHEWKWWS